MILGKKNDVQLIADAIVPAIESNMNEWQMVNINLLKDSMLTLEDISNRILQLYEAHEGVILHSGNTKITMLIRFGQIDNYAYKRREIEKTVPQHCCQIVLRKMNDNILAKMKGVLSGEDDIDAQTQNMYDERLARDENVILIIDDDKFVRSSMKKLLMTIGNVCEAENGKQAVTEYVNENPDIIFLDIHMPDQNGLDLIKHIMDVDPDAYIVLLSADSSAGNIMQATEEGAIGFLSKPASKNRVQEYISKCATIR